jgi:outer membrane protein OmpA-like peptidoglycan-associated protein
MKQILSIFYFTLIFFHTVFAQLEMLPYMNEYRLAGLFLNDEIQLINTQFTGRIDRISAFKFKGEELKFEEGILLTTGNVAFAHGPNNSWNLSSVSSAPGFAVSAEKIFKTFNQSLVFDEVVWEIEFIPQCQKLQFEYVFGSEEYPEYVNRKYNDFFGIFIQNESITRPKNVALVPETNEFVSINTINHLKNSDWFVDNSKNRYSQLQADGFTKTLTAVIDVLPQKWNKLTFTLADVADDQLDSYVFIASKSLSCVTSFKSNTPNIVEIRVPFEINEFVIPEYYIDSLYHYIQQLLPQRNAILTLTGHTDLTGDDEKNKLLSLKRAEAVKEFLIEYFDFESSKIITKGMGASFPLKNDTSPESNQINRRVTFTWK